MTEAVTFAVAVAAATAVLSFISYTGADKRGQRLVLGAIFLSAMISSFANISLDLEDITTEEYEPEYPSRAHLVCEEAFCQGVQALIEGSFSFEGCVQVRTEGFSLSTLSADRVIIILSDRGIYIDKSRVLSLVSDNGIKNCEVFYIYEI